MMKTIGTGRLARDPVLNDDESSVFCEFTLATDEWRTAGNEKKKYTHFLDFEIWSTAAKTLVENCRAGDLIEVDCTPRSRKSGVIHRVNNFSILKRKYRNDQD